MERDIEKTKLIEGIIEKLRHKLLDMTARNPLLSTKFSERSSSVIRIVDELPAFLLKEIAEKKMKFKPLPPLKDKEPEDENTPKFRAAFFIAKNNDDKYNDEMESIDSYPFDSADKSAQAERNLRDRIREELKMPPRQTKDTLTLVEHAKENNIDPSYDLPSETEEHSDGRHTDNKIQTLFLPTKLNSKLRALHSKERTFKEETGISVLQMAFGFLEWNDPKSKKSQLSPLALMPVQLKAKETPRGVEYWVSSDEGTAEENKILAKKFLEDFNIELPAYSFSTELKSSIEKYFLKIDKLKPPTITHWKVRRQVAVGVFDSTPLAMYHDIDPQNWAFAAHTIISTLFTGSENESSTSPFAVDYEVDEPEIENKVPLLIADADSSQFSTIVDAMNGRNLAVEGPPGSGKSQTIVNTIAAFLAKGKKVLFVAEKTAALEVVRSKLQALGVGDFLLPLQTIKASKGEVYKSIKNRIEINSCEKNSTRELAKHKKYFDDARTELKTYINILLSPSAYGDEFNVHQIIGNYIKQIPVYNSLPEPVKEIKIPIKLEKIEEIITMCKDIETQLDKTSECKSCWSDIQIADVDPIQRDDILNLTKKISEKSHEIFETRKGLENYQIAPQTLENKLTHISNLIGGIPSKINAQDIATAYELKTEKDIVEVEVYCTEVKKWHAEERAIKEYISTPLNQETLVKVKNVIDFLTKNNFDEMGLVTDSLINRKALFLRGWGLINKISNNNSFTLKKCNDKKNQLEELKRFSKHKEIFYNPNELLAEKIFSLSNALSQLLKKQDNLTNNTNIKTTLGEYFKAENTNSKKLENCLDLGKLLVKEKKFKNVILQAAKKMELQKLQTLIGEIGKKEKHFYEEIKKLAVATNATPEKWFNDGDSFEEFARVMRKKTEDKRGLGAHSQLFGKKDRLIQEGYGDFLEIMLTNNHQNLAEAIQAKTFRKVAGTIYKKHPEMGSYRGEKLNELREKFRQADKKIIELSREKLKSDLKEKANPPLGNGTGSKNSYTDLALLHHEVEKKRHPSVRKLIERAGQALLELKPCWMMSPLAVAQYLGKRNLEFDLLIIDEASQMTPENAIGALLRTKQAMIVGDTEQLPPTSFFNKVLDDDESETATTEESILEIANSRFRPKRLLRWHYRSKHAKLIAFCNKHIYENRLIVFPSPKEEECIQYRKIEGNYSSGLNYNEAKEMVDGIVKFMKEESDKSLGVAVMNKKQSELLEELFNNESQNEPKVKKYLENWNEKNDGLESFFIKNLENVQGDERDVIFIGTVYGPSHPGEKVMQRFGPINQIAGKRRLNVLFTRAKHKIVTFSSMTSADIQENKHGGGATMLKHWLEYSASGGKILEGGTETGREPDSPFEEHVIEQVRSIGCEAIPQVGVKGYFIDIGIKHPGWPHGYLMGVECDGANWHSSHSARDRDRLRQEVLEGLGWDLYRIWSTDWFEDPVRETKTLRIEIEKMLKEKQRMLKEKQGV